MIDGIVASRIARMVHEERVRSLAPVRDYDEWLTHSAGHWQSVQVGDLLLSFAKGLSSIAGRLKPKRGAVPDSPLTAQEPGSVPG